MKAIALGQPDAPTGAAGSAPTALPPSGLGLLYVVAALTSAGTNLMFIGMSFYTSQRFGWNLAQNFLLAGAQGVVYIIGALSAHSLSRRLDRSANCILLLTLMGLTAGVAMIHPYPRTVAAMLVLYAAVSAVFWPMLESLLSQSADARTLSRQIGAYNLIWSGAGVVVIAVNGTLIKYFPAGVFLIPLAGNALGALLLGRDLMRKRGPILARALGRPVSRQVAVVQPTTHLQPERELVGKRALALWLSRICLPATFCAIYSLMPLMPFLSVVRVVSQAKQTVVCDVWIAARFAAFAMLGATVWWHTRPRALLVAAIVMLAAFLGTSMRLSDVPGLGGLPLAVDLIWFCAWQIALGLALGMIYSSSLYFGMVLSDGSTEHGGYHEALIGVGQVLGPGFGVLTQTLWSNNLRAGINAIAGLLTLSIIAAGIATVCLGRRSRHN